VGRFGVQFLASGFTPPGFSLGGKPGSPPGASGLQPTPGWNVLINAGT